MKITAKSVTIARLLNWKARLAGILSTTGNEIYLSNSYLEINPPVKDTLSLLEKYKDIQELIVEVKALISVSNMPMYVELHRLSELKAFKMMLSSIPTKAGTFFDGYEGKEVRYAAQISSFQKDSIAEDLQKKINRTQDMLDNFNITLVEINIDLANRISHYID